VPHDTCLITLPMNCSGLVIRWNELTPAGSEPRPI